VAILTFAQVAIVLAIPFVIGIADSRRAARLTELELDQQRREQAQRIAAADAVRAERARIARELHDVVAHEITVMTLHAEGARRRAEDPAVAEALATNRVREASEATRYRQYYGIDLADRSIYHLVLDSTDRRPDALVTEIVGAARTAV